MGHAASLRLLTMPPGIASQARLASHPISRAPRGAISPTQWTSEPGRSVDLPLLCRHHALVRELVRPLVARVARVALDPVPLHVVRVGEGLELLPEFDV